MKDNARFEVGALLKKRSKEERGEGGEGEERARSRYGGGGTFVFESPGARPRRER